MVSKVLSVRRKIQRLRSKSRNNIPDFVRYDADKYFRLERQESWRKPRGRDNKSRLKIRGFPPLAQPGYRKPKEVRNLHPSGLAPVLVSNLKDLDSLQSKANQVIVIISSSVGLKKRLEIIKKARELNLRLANGGVYE
ncbi:50S ribosomal protein L32e [Sulfuracidifex metallicus]|jgi:large subunit ribosomal protein L32e|uniref:Large ribosomal subunit protein eL32 n=1 Tax=Sulfuracidifex metallicus DSM 6482 = JCM 9184 TaxID=523847 RepID=A0A6A9QRW4_SULME|nr:50S ribosomal protein L32e [Sulfuracidifex metallicus]MUN28543.1 50S ribosomal protein L32e [Sulfuracidifex metallicus DSM 6482 = JCM 9184]WOE50919.1 50S ribosomal protein L32e [Sulfuracidifex metallicus DSM 6482 = JCM 9184]